MKPFSASAFAALMADLLRNYPREGLNIAIDRNGEGVTISTASAQEWRHPWFVSTRWELDEANKGRWMAYLKPGLVNGRDVFIEGKDDKGRPVQVALTDESPAGLRMVWRNPLESLGARASANLDLIVDAGEGYPKFFESLGVKPARKEGSILDVDVPDPARTRQIRACDIILSTPRLATAQDVSVDLLTGEATIGTRYLNSAYASATVKHRLLALPKWVPPTEPTAMERLMGSAVESQSDEILMSTVWMVSPPDAGDGDEPDETWQPYPQHFQFYNLFHASKQPPPSRPPNPITLRTGLLNGMADQIFAAILAPINAADSAFEAAIRPQQFQGRYWSV